MLDVDVMSVLWQADVAGAVDDELLQPLLELHPRAAELQLAPATLRSASGHDQSGSSVLCLVSTVSPHTDGPVDSLTRCRSEHSLAHLAGKRLTDWPA